MKKSLLITLLMGVLAGKTFAQDVETTKKALRDSYTAIEQKDFARFASHLSDNCIDYGAGPEPVRGKEAVINMMKSIFNAFSDVKITVEDIAVSGNKYYIKNTLTAKHTGPLLGMIPATGKDIVWSDVDIVEVDKNGKCVAHWVNNPNALLEQVGYLAFANPNTAAVLKGYELFGKGDFKGIGEACTDDIVWDVMDNPDPKIARVYNGKKELGMFFKNLSEAMQITKFEPYRFMADGDHVTAFINGEYKLAGSSKLYKNTLVHHFLVRNGKIASFKELVDKPQEITMAKK